MTVIHRRRGIRVSSAGQLPDPAVHKIPARGENVTTRIPDDDVGINFEIAKMVRYVQEFRADPLVVQTARKVVSLCGAKDRECELNAIFLWAKGNFRYVNDPLGAEVTATPAHQLAELMTPPHVLKTILGEELVSRISGGEDSLNLYYPPNSLRASSCFEKSVSGPRPKISGDCDEAATLISTMLAAIGIESRFRFGGTQHPNGDCNYHHVWVQGAKQDGTWVDMDITEIESDLGWAFSGFTCYGHVKIF
jgi:hypothetical protein